MIDYKNNQNKSLKIHLNRNEILSIFNTVHSI